MNHTRDHALDYIRAILMLLVVSYHFNTLFDSYSVTGLHSFPYVFVNGNFGRIAVNCFWLLSGICLMKSTQKFDLVNYYKKRCVKVFPVYWLAWLVMYVVRAYIVCDYPPIARGELWRIVYTLIGLDGYCIGYYTKTFFLVGEWFLGVYVIIMLLFPILRWAYEHCFWLMSAAILCGYLINLRLGILTWRGGEFSLSAAGAMAWVGCMLYRWLDKLDLKWGIAGSALFLALLFIPLPFPQLQVMALMSLGFFIGMYVFLKNVKPSRIVQILCRYSYAVFVIHHSIGYVIFEQLEGKTLGVGYVLLIFAGYLLLVAAAAFLVQNAADLPSRWISRKKKQTAAE